MLAQLGRTSQHLGDDLRLRRTRHAVPAKTTATAASGPSQPPHVAGAVRFIAQGFGAGSNENSTSSRTAAPAALRPPCLRLRRSRRRRTSIVLPVNAGPLHLPITPICRRPPSFATTSTGTSTTLNPARLVVTPATHDASKRNCHGPSRNARSGSLDGRVGSHLCVRARRGSSSLRPNGRAHRSALRSDRHDEYVDRKTSRIGRRLRPWGKRPPGAARREPR